MKLTKLLILFLLLSFKGFSRPATTITSSITIDQSWIDAHPGPWEITTSSVTVTFGQNLTISDPTQYFIVKAENVTIDGANKIVTLNGIPNYPGLIRAVYGGMETPSFNSDNALIKNIGVVNIGSTLANRGGYISGANNRAEIRNCYSTGPISAVESGGIAGAYNEGDISNCYSRGAISGDKSGGITVYSMNAIISNCYSTGEISGSSSGGIVGMNNYSDIENCYSSGVISNSTPFVDLYDTWAAAGAIAPATSSPHTITNSGRSVGWDNNTANSYLTGEGTTVWNTSVSPYTLLIPVAGPTFANSGSITMCELGSFYLAPSTTDGTWATSTPTVATVNSSGYVTALSSGTTDISLTTDGVTVTATINVVSASSANATLAITDGLASYKFNNNPQGPIGSGNVNYVGYNGKVYFSQTWPIKTGFYRANNQSGDNAGCPYEYYIFRCTTCGTVPEYITRPQGTLSGNTSGIGQLTYTSSNGGGPFTIVYQATGASPVTVNNISSTVAFNVVTPTITTSYKLISVTDESTNASTDFSGATASITVTTYTIGQAALGGKIAYILQPGDNGYDANMQHGLIASTTDIYAGIKWFNGFDISTTATATAIGTGFANTNTIIRIQGNTGSYAAKVARDFNGGLFDDWYLPSKDELNKLYLNRVAIGGFADYYYWSSTEVDFNYAWAQNFYDGGQSNGFKYVTVYVRAIRAF